MKAALRASLKDSNWVDKLPWVMLGIRTAPKEDLQSSSVELVYGQPLQVPGDFVPSATVPWSGTLQRSTLLDNARLFVPVPTSCPGLPQSHILAGLQTADYVFIRQEAHKGTLCPPYKGPFRVLESGDKYLVVDRGAPWSRTPGSQHPCLSEPRWDRGPPRWIRLELTVSEQITMQKAELPLLIPSIPNALRNDYPGNPLLPTSTGTTEFGPSHCFSLVMMIIDASHYDRSGSAWISEPITLPLSADERRWSDGKVSRGAPLGDTGRVPVNVPHAMSTPFPHRPIPLCFLTQYLRLLQQPHKTASINKGVEKSKNEVILLTEVITKSMCQPREVLVDIFHEYPEDTEHTYVPSCVVLNRCGGCCNVINRGDETSNTVMKELFSWHSTLKPEDAFPARTRNDNARQDILGADLATIDVQELCFDSQSVM
ncbi:hypothetical protein FQN60_016734 [Etheostoma spectabile]|uniref:Platelet-derived growth factor (PDGF) family profile domain-containing protein n=1 Tax=Etheostoma spectabile TaxID=54343 RepID=A0A5J5CZR1_9PERO|nr:hypothetical protein FQN60_016734 [Etheostoma spectabile]